MKNYIALLPDQDDTEDSTVVLLTAENEDAAIKQLIENQLGFDMTDENERNMMIHMSNDNPFMIAEVKGKGFTKKGKTISFEQVYLDDEQLDEMFGVLTEEEDEE